MRVNLPASGSRILADDPRPASAATPPPPASGSRIPADDPRPALAATPLQPVLRSRLPVDDPRPVAQCPGTVPRVLEAREHSATTPARSMAWEPSPCTSDPQEPATMLFSRP